MNKAKQVYKATKCKRREITFYKKDIDIYEFSKSINFQKFVKQCLRDAYCEINYLNAFKNKLNKLNEDGDDNGNGNL